MKILILGGTGAIGFHILDMIKLHPEMDCTVTSRHEHTDDRNIKYVKGNAHDKSFLADLLTERWDTIIDFMAYTTGELSDRIAELLSGTNQYVYLSSARVYSESKTRLTEESPRLLDTVDDKIYLETDEYALAKARQENLIKSSGNNYTIVRPYITFSEYRFQLGVMEKENWLYRALQGRTILFSKDIAEKVTTLTYGYDVAKGIFGIIGNSNSLGKVYHIAAEETYKWKDVLGFYTRIIENITGHPVKIKYTDEWKPLFGGFAYQVKYDRLFNRSFDSGRISRDVKGMAFTPVETAIEKALVTFIKRPKFGHIDIFKEAAKDRITGDWIKFSEIPTFKLRVLYILVRLGLINYKK